MIKPKKSKLNNDDINTPGKWGDDIIESTFNDLENKIDNISDELQKPTIINKVRKLLEDEGFVVSSESDYGIQKYMTLWRKNEWFKLDNKTQVRPPQKLQKKFGW